MPGKEISIQHLDALIASPNIFEEQDSLLDAMREVRNMCVDSSVQQQFESLNLHRKVELYLIQLLETKNFTIFKNIVMGIQLLSNSMTANAEIQSRVWPPFLNDCKLLRFITNYLLSAFCFLRTTV